MLRGARYAGGAVAGAAGTVVRGAGWVGHRVGDLATRRGRAVEELEAGAGDTDHGDHDLPSHPGADAAER
jgi:hypothetical protein